MITHREELVTPERAEADLAAASMLNRSLSKKRIQRYADDILNDRWLKNGQAIIYNGDGGLVNGFHRFHAIKLAKKPVWMLVVRGIESSALPTIDDVKTRTLSDVLVMNGTTKEKEARVLAGAARLVQAYEAGSAVWMDRGHNRESNIVLEEFIENTPSLRDCLKIGMEVGKVFRKSFQSARATALYYIFKNKSRWEADLFFEMLKTGKVPDPESPVVTLRERLYAETKGMSFPNEREMMAIVIKTWNAFRNGQKIGLLRFRKVDKFPEIL